MQLQDLLTAYYIVLENTPFQQDCCLSPTEMKDYLNILIILLRTYCNPLTHPKGNLSFLVQDGNRMRHFSPFLFMILSLSFLLHLCRRIHRNNPVDIENTAKEEEKTLIKTSSAGICCLTAVNVFTQACIIMVCLVYRSSQKLFRSPCV